VFPSQIPTLGHFNRSRTAGNKCNLHDEGGCRFAICKTFGPQFLATLLAVIKCLVLTKTDRLNGSARHLQSKHDESRDDRELNTNMNLFHQFDIFQETVQVTLQVVGCMLTAGLAVIPVLIWLLIEPVFQLVEEARHRDELNNQAPGRDAIHRGIGLALLVFGILMIVYGFNASGSVIPDLPPAFAGAPTAKTVGLLLGGSAAVVVGVTLAIRGSGKSSNRTRSKPSARQYHLQKPNHQPRTTYNPSPIARPIAEISGE
jgi:hypothetical protein